MDKNSALIQFKYQQLEYQLEVTKTSLEYGLDVDYDRECGSFYEDCDHEYSRCMVITKIEKNSFDFFEFCKNNLICLSREEEPNKDVLEKLCKTLSSIPFQDYIECSAERDYYGDVLVREADLKGAVERIQECLKLEFQDVVVI